jgi:hypothetical protein
MNQQNNAVKTHNVYATIDEKLKAPFLNISPGFTKHARSFQIVR